MFGFLRSLTAPSPGIDPTRAVADVAAGRALLIDVREPAEVSASGKAKGAVNLPLSRLAQLADPASGLADKRLRGARDKGLTLVLYCASGARSGRAADVLRRFGHDQVHNLGSLAEWRAGGGAVVR